MVILESIQEEAFMSKGLTTAGRTTIARRSVIAALAGLGILAATSVTKTLAQNVRPQLSTGTTPPEVYVPIPGFDPTSMDTSVSPCDDFYKFACGKFAANHPIPADQSGVDQFYALYNVNTQELRGILEKTAAAGTDRTPDAQKIGDYYKACMNTDLIEQKGLAPVQP